MKKKMTGQKGITLVALVVTIVVLLILAGVTINLVIGQNGLINRAKEAAQKTKDAAAAENSQMDQLATELAALSNTRSVFEGGNWNSTLGICTPKLGNNMVGVYWSDGSKNDNGTYKASLTSTEMEITSDQEGFSWNDWYNYVAGDNSTDSKTSKWANAKSTVDGSYFVWIPRYEYKLTGKEIGGTGTNKAGTITVKFIDQNTTTASKDYKIHPAFTTNLQLGGWDKELSGVWVAKYEMSMEQTTDNGATWNNIKLKSGNAPLSDTVRAVSKPNNYSWSYININYCFDNSLNYSSKQNTGANSHLMKNSEWGAIAYLTHSQYGRNGNEVGMNTYNESTTEESTTYNNSMTGIGSSETSTTITVNDDNRYNGKYGMNASTTGNLYGIYDMNGGKWEYTAALYSKYISNNGSLLYAKTKSGVYNKNTNESQLSENSSKYVTIYPIDENISGNDASIHFHYAKWKDIYGDAIYETSSNTGTGKSWFNDGSDEDTDGADGPFCARGGISWGGTLSGIFAFVDGDGTGWYYHSYRIVLVCE